MTTEPDLTSSDSRLNLEEHKLSLARDLLDDIELSRLGPEQLLLKASRLARLVDEDKTRDWLGFELRGYPDTDLGRRYMSHFGRWTDKKTNVGYWSPLSSVGAWAVAMQAEIQQLRVPDVSVSISSANPYEHVTGFAGMNLATASQPVNSTLLRLQQCTTQIAQLREIQSRVMAEIHTFAVRTYYRLAFSGTAESIFREHQSYVDRLLRDRASDAVEKIPAITARLSDDDPEAISQALNSCRRMIKAFADAVQPGENKQVEEEGEQYEIGSDKVLNRIQYFLSEKCRSKGRRERLNRNLRALWDRASSGSHAEVAPDEAKALFLQTYLTLGEILVACTPGRATVEAPREDHAS